MFFGALFPFANFPIQRPPPRTPRLEAHSAASTLPFAVGAQRARLAALNALSVAGNAYPSSDDTAVAAAATAAPVASICPPAGERRLDGYGRPAGVRTVAVLGREAVSAAGAIGLAVATAAKEEGVQEFGGRYAGKEEAKEFGGRYAVGVQVSVEVGNADVSGVVEALALGGRYEEAADVVLEGLAHQVCFWGFGRRRRGLFFFFCACV